MKEQIKRHFISFAVTFLAMFLLLIVPSLYTGAWEGSVLIALIVSASRSAFKIAWEAFLVPLFNLIIQWAKDYSK